MYIFGPCACVRIKHDSAKLSYLRDAPRSQMAFKARVIARYLMKVSELGIKLVVFITLLIGIHTDLIEDVHDMTAERGISVLK